jgi:hypothetical protein
MASRPAAALDSRPVINMVPVIKPAITAARPTRRGAQAVMASSAGW